MARRSYKSVIAKIFNKKKEEEIKSFGDVTIADSWDKVTLKMFEDYIRRTEPDENGNEKQLTVYDVLEIFSNMKREDIEQLPVEFVDALMSRLSFMEFPMKEYKPSNYLKVGDDTYMINFYEQMREKEYEDCQLVIKSDKYDYAGILAIVCRKIIDEQVDDLSKETWKITEKYDTEFANVKYEARKKAFENMPVGDVMPLMAFFLNRWMQSEQVSQAYLEKAKDETGRFVENIETSLKDMDLPKWRLMLCKIQLRRLKKLVNSL